MKTASRTLQILALGACLIAQAHGAMTMPGVRRAISTIGGATAPITLPVTTGDEIAKTRTA